ncbi:MAG: chemotaxis protein CheA [Sphingomonadales bacterium RIFCSPHIGHO2_01_FULL_65_20]|nr:MAG: chemotaxis protein CheA [Sphingomonadales bacterium RIFCSPHIGHO2_01_FULL_65_20]
MHTIKGSGGIFGFDPIVAFAHVVEGVLGEIRNGKAAVGYDLVALLLSCGDHLGALVDCVAEQGADPDEELLARGDALLEQLHGYTSPGRDPGEARSGSDMPARRRAKTPAASGSEGKSCNWHISLRFGPNVLRNGMDPLSFLRYLGTLGEVVNMNTLFDAMPDDAAGMDPESCHLGLEMDFKSCADKETISNVFEFVRDDCKVRILPPNCLISEYIELINALPEGVCRLGDLLVSSGALTLEELEEGLQIQQCPAGLNSGTCLYKTKGECNGKRCLADPALGCRFQGAQEGTPPHPLLGEILVEEGMVQREIVDGAIEKQKQSRDSKQRERKFVHVQADKLDTLINLVGELVIASAGASLLAQRTGNAALQEAISLVSQLVGEIRGGALQLRMVPIGEIFSRFRRTVHDLSRELNKEIDLVIDGAETELDKTVIERIGDPLMHLVRNAMDHGIEPASRRSAVGKPEKGTVRLNAFHDSGSIVIEVSDDGAGLNREKILKKALERGVVTPDQSLSDQEIYNLVFEPGFSTTENVTSLSGRGVGMDVVRRNVEALRGMAEIESQEGRGTTVRMRLPLTLAIIDGFLMGVGSASYVVPLDMVVECVELDEKHAARGRHYVDLRGEVLPFLRLREQFREAGQVSRRENVVVVQYAGRKAGLVVDKLMGEFQTVIRPLGKIFANLQGVSGTTILGSGEVALILDVPSLIQRAAGVEPRSASAA